MKVVLTALKTVLNVIWPKSKWANAIYLVLGLIIAQFDTIKEVVQAIIALF